MADIIDKTIFEDLKACDPDSVVLRTQCKFNKADNQYFVNVWGRTYCVDLNRYEIFDIGHGNKIFQEYLFLFILYYLIKSKNIQPSGAWISPKDLPDGATFFRGPHTIPGNLIAKNFGNDTDSFKKKSLELKGIPIDMADVAFNFQITPTIPVAVLYFLGDEDFPSEATLLFDKTIGLHLPLDIIFAIAVEVCNILGKATKKYISE